MYSLSWTCPTEGGKGHWWLNNRDKYELTRFPFWYRDNSLVRSSHFFFNSPGVQNNATVVYYLSIELASHLTSWTIFKKFDDWTKGNFCSQLHYPSWSYMYMYNNKMMFFLCRSRECNKAVHGTGELQFIQSHPILSIHMYSSQKHMNYMKICHVHVILNSFLLVNEIYNQFTSGNLHFQEHNIY